MTHQVKWLGHASFEITTSEDLTILIDPYRENNPSAPAEEPETADLVLVTHDHFDHLENIAARTAEDGVIVGQPEVLAKIQDSNPDSLEEENFINGGGGMNIGGTVEVRGIEITMVQAFHSCDVGSPAGYVVRLPVGKTIYHAGDTGIFSGMELLGELYDIDLALLPIGSVFTMDPAQAALAVELLQPDKVIPMHFGTFPILVPDADEFIELTEKHEPDAEVVVLDPGDSYKF